MKPIRFEAEVREGRRGGAWVEIPFDVNDRFGSRGRVKVVATFDDVQYRGSLAPIGGGVHVLGIKKGIRTEIGKSIGDFVTVELSLDTEPRIVDVPSELADALAKHKTLNKLFDKMAYTHRKEFCRWVVSGKKSETRRRRADKAIKMLKDGETLS